MTLICCMAISASPFATIAATGTPSTSLILSPLSPVATQHSLPSGRYSLLGPDLHRLDRTSLRLAHLFNRRVATLFVVLHRQQRQCVARDHQFLVGRNDINRNSAVPPRYPHGMRRIRRRIEL